MRCGTSLRPHLMNLGVGRQPACVYLGTPLPQERGTVQWRSRGHGRGCRHWHLTARHVTDDPMATKWPHPLPRGSCQSRIAGPEIRASHDVGSQNPRPATMLNHRPETVTMLRHKIRGRPTQGSPGFTCHSVEPDRSRSTGSHSVEQVVRQSQSLVQQPHRVDYLHTRGLGDLPATGLGAVSYTHLTLPTTPYV